ncbi:hypothetical protein MHYP_G00213250 [Metynnis hypsauchen]
MIQQQLAVNFHGTRLLADAKPVLTLPKTEIWISYWKSAARCSSKLKRIWSESLKAPQKEPEKRNREHHYEATEQ